MRFEYPPWRRRSTVSRTMVRSRLGGQARMCRAWSGARQASLGGPGRPRCSDAERTRGRSKPGEGGRSHGAGSGNRGRAMAAGRGCRSERWRHDGFDAAAWRGYCTADSGLGGEAGSRCGRATRRGSRRPSRRCCAARSAGSRRLDRESRRTPEAGRRRAQVHAPRVLGGYGSRAERCGHAAERAGRRGRRRRPDRGARRRGLGSRRCPRRGGRALERLRRRADGGWRARGRRRRQATVHPASSLIMPGVRSPQRPRAGSLRPGGHSRSLASISVRRHAVRRAGRVRTASGRCRVSWRRRWGGSLGVTCALTVAGRTDPGVHAWGQVAAYEGPVAACRGAQLAAAARCGRADVCGGSRRLRRAQRRARAAPTATACSPVASDRRSRRAGRCSGRAAWTARRWMRALAAARQARLHGVHADRDRPHALRAQCAAGALGRGRARSWRSRSRPTRSCATWSACWSGRCSRSAAAPRPLEDFEALLGGARATRGRATARAARALPDGACAYDAGRSSATAPTPP